LPETRTLAPETPRPAARRAFAGLDSANRYAILFRIHDAKRPETRARRIEQFVTMLARGETVYPQRPTSESEIGDD